MKIKTVYYIELFFRSDICQHCWCQYQGAGPGPSQLGVEYTGHWRHQEEHQDAPHSQAQGAVGAELQEGVSH